MVKVAVCYGGPSLEHEISIITALQAMSAMDPLLYEIHPVWMTKEKRFYTGSPLYQKKFYDQPDFSKLKELFSFRFADVCFLCFHGGFGESGGMQAMLENEGIPFTGCDKTAASVAMDKALCKRVAASCGIEAVPGITLAKRDAIANFTKSLEVIEHTLPYPLFVKPNHLGSSLGVGRAHCRKELERALANVFAIDSKALIEKCILSPLEINVSVLQGSPPRVSVVEIPIGQDGQVLTYDDKYKRGGSKTGEQGMASLSRVIDPKDLDLKIKEKVQRDALRAFEAMDLKGVVRFDFIMDPKDSKIYFNELNPIPGSLSYYLWEKSSPPLLYPDLIDHLISKEQAHREAE
jgi:D-alanine-D-alanine ligase